MSRDEQRRAGRALRKRVPRSAHGAWTLVRRDRQFRRLLARAERSRLRRLLPLRHERMASSLLDFFRGAGAIMAADLARTPVIDEDVQLCGDAHLRNFGVVGTPERRQVFDIDDFDETVRGPWEWDLKRLATSFFLLSLQNGLGPHVGEALARHCAATYRRRMRREAGRPYLDVWFDHLDQGHEPGVLGARSRKLLRHMALRGRGHTDRENVRRLARRTAGGYRLRLDPPRLTAALPGIRRETVHRLFDDYLRTVPDDLRRVLRRYELADVAGQVSGVGSVGNRCALLLLASDPEIEDVVFLQLREALPSTLRPPGHRPRHENEGRRVVAGQHLLQEVSDVFLGWGRADGHDFYFRHYRDLDQSLPVEAMGRNLLHGHAELCAATLARAHARGGDAALIAGYLGRGHAIDRALGRFAVHYGRQVVADHRAFRRSG